MGSENKIVVGVAIALSLSGGPEALAQSASEPSVALPPVTVQPAERRAVRRAQPAPAAQRAAPARTPVREQATPPARPVNASNTSDRYVARTSATATKTDTPVLETPQSISTVTRRQMDDQNVQTVANALRYSAGVLSDADTNSRFDSVFIRGFGAFGTATNYVSFLDGLKLPRGQAFANTAIDPFLLDRVEVLKGPSAVLYGQTSPGGLVNQIRTAIGSTV